MKPTKKQLAAEIAELREEIRALRDELRARPVLPVRPIEPWPQPQPAVPCVAPLDTMDRHIARWS